MINQLNHYIGKPWLADIFLPLGFNSRLKKMPRVETSRQLRNLFFLKKILTEIPEIMPILDALE